MTTQLITPGQENRIVDLFRDMLRALELTKEEAQEIIADGGTMQWEIKLILKKLSIRDKRFGRAIKKFKITVPVDYNHDNQVDLSVAKAEEQNTVYFRLDGFSSQSFARATNKLEPGKTYWVKIFPILSAVNAVDGEDCLAFLRKQRAILAGGQGITLVYDLQKERLPAGKYIVSFDKKEALPEEVAGLHAIPRTYVRSDGSINLDFSYFECLLHDDSCLLCICDK